MKAGEILEVVFTDPGAQPDLTAWCRMSGSRLLEVEWGKGVGKAVIQK